MYNQLQQQNGHNGQYGRTPTLVNSIFAGPDDQGPYFFEINKNTIASIIKRQESLNSQSSLKAKKKKFQQTSVVSKASKNSKKFQSNMQTTKVKEKPKLVIHRKKFEDSPQLENKVGYQKSLTGDYNQQFYTKINDVVSPYFKVQKLEENNNRQEHNDLQQKQVKYEQTENQTEIIVQIKSQFSKKLNNQQDMSKYVTRGSKQRNNLLRSPSSQHESSLTPIKASKSSINSNSSKKIQESMRQLQKQIEEENDSQSSKMNKLQQSISIKDNEESIQSPMNLFRKQTKPKKRGVNNIRIQKLDKGLSKSNSFENKKFAPIQIDMMNPQINLIPDQQSSKNPSAYGYGFQFLNKIMTLKKDSMLDIRPTSELNGHPKGSSLYKSISHKSLTNIDGGSGSSDIKRVNTYSQSNLFDNSAKISRLHADSHHFQQESGNRSKNPINQSNHLQLGKLPFVKMLSHITKIERSSQNNISYKSQNPSIQSQRQGNQNQGKPTIKKWNKLSNILKSLMLIKRADTKNLDNPNEIVEEISNYKLRQKPTEKIKPIFEDFIQDDNLANAFNLFRQKNKFFQYIESGGEKDIEKIKEEIQNDPKRHIRSINDPDHLINKRNENGQTPLYVGAKYGHLKVIEFFIELGADPHITSLVQIKESNDWKCKFEEETILEVAIRWSHLTIVYYLLENIKWTKFEIKKAVKICFQTGNISIRKQLMAYKSTNFGCCFLCL
eukprot:403362111